MNIGDFVACHKNFSGEKKGMIIATNPGNQIERFDNYHTQKVYYVLLLEGVVEGPLFQSEITLMLTLQFQLICMNLKNFSSSGEQDNNDVINFLYC